MAGRISQAADEALVVPAPNVRVTQAAEEALVVATSVSARASQAAAEVLYIPTLTISVPAAVVDVIGPVPIYGVAIFVPAAVVDVITADVATPLKFLTSPFDVGGIGTWSHDRPFDILQQPLEYSHDRPFDIGSSIGYRHTRPFDVLGPLRIEHERPFAIDGDTAAPEVGSDQPGLTAVTGLILTAPTDGTNVLHVASTTGVQPGMTAVIGIYRAGITAVGLTTLTLDRIIP